MLPPECCYTWVRACRDYRQHLLPGKWHTPLLGSIVCEALMRCQLCFCISFISSSLISVFAAYQCHGSWFDVFVLCLVSYVLILCPFFASLQCSLFSPLSFPLPPCMFVSFGLSVLCPSCFLLRVLLIISPALLSSHLFLVPSSVCLCT